MFGSFSCSRSPLSASLCMPFFWSPLLRFLCQAHFSRFDLHLHKVLGSVWGFQFSCTYVFWLALVLTASRNGAFDLWETTLWTSEPWSATGGNIVVSFSFKFPFLISSALDLNLWIKSLDILVEFFYAKCKSVNVGHGAHMSWYWEPVESNLSTFLLLAYSAVYSRSKLDSKKAFEQDTSQFGCARSRIPLDSIVFGSCWKLLINSLIAYSDESGVDIIHFCCQSLVLWSLLIWSICVFHECFYR